MSPGWYEDPEEAGYLRYWDGVAWTAERKPVPAVTAAPAPPAPPEPPEAPPATTAPTKPPTTTASHPTGTSPADGSPTRARSAAQRSLSGLRRTGGRPDAAGGVAPLEPSSRRWGVTLALAFPFGLLGFHRFYVGKVPIGVLQLMLYLASSAATDATSGENVAPGLFAFAAFIWWVRDLIWIALQRFTDGEGRRIRIGVRSPRS